jgi:hypothetical protein
MKRLITLLLQFYSSMWMLNILFSIFGMIVIVKNGATFIGTGITLKCVGYLTCISYQYFMEGKNYFYYRNAGYSIRRLYSYVCLADMLFYFILVIAYTLLPHGIAHIKS